MNLASIMRKTSAIVGSCLALAFFLSPFAACGDRFFDDDLYYWLESDSSTQVYVSGLRNSSATHITIPATVVYEYTDYNDRDDEGNARVKRRTCTVTSIGNSAFYGCSGLTLPIRFRTMSVPPSAGHPALFRQNTKRISQSAPRRKADLRE